MYVNVCKCIRNWPLPIGAFQDQCKQIVMRKLDAEIEERATGDQAHLKSTF